MFFDGGFGLFYLVTFGLSIAMTIGIIVLIVLGVRWLIRHSGPDRPVGPAAPAEDAALATLRERFARGDIDAAEFEERKRTLGG